MMVSLRRSQPQCQLAMCQLIGVVILFSALALDSSSIGWAQEGGAFQLNAIVRSSVANALEFESAEKSVREFLPNRTVAMAEEELSAD